MAEITTGGPELFTIMTNQHNSSISHHGVREESSEQQHKHLFVVLSECCESVLLHALTILASHSHIEHQTFTYILCCCLHYYFSIISYFSFFS